MGGANIALPYVCGGYLHGTSGASKLHGVRLASSRGLAVSQSRASAAHETLSWPLPRDVIFVILIAGGYRPLNLDVVE